jgi:methyltransferase (TIGR00027 family)
MKDNKASGTSLLTSILVLLLGALQKLPKEVFQSQIAFLRGAEVIHPLVLRVLSSPWFAFVLQLLIVLVKRESLEGFRVRKLYVEDQVRTALNDRRLATTQVLTVAAGYDTLCYRLSREFSNVTFVEVDHPATGKMKAKGLKAMGWPSNLFTIHADLAREELVDVLKTQPFFDTKANTVIVIEGLLFYLTDDQVKDLFTALAQSTGPKSMAVFDFFDRDESTKRLNIGVVYNLLLSNAVSLIGEPFCWGCNPERLPSFLSSTGWTLTGKIRKVDIEHIATAKKAFADSTVGM